ncbi:hypothetical protein Tco_0800572 [Tanacetum coccineum]|uniref:Uncharacterized protein n=1 Tax=Tanacetum coccineum TaxID=301880 RepID=A0ABQ4ZTI7_9ASTR
MMVDAGVHLTNDLLGRCSVAFWERAIMSGGAGGVGWMRVLSIYIYSKSCVESIVREGASEEAVGGDGKWELGYWRKYLVERYMREVVHGCRACVVDLCESKKDILYLGDVSKGEGEWTMRVTSARVCYERDGDGGYFDGCDSRGTL